MKRRRLSTSTKLALQPVRHGLVPVGSDGNVYSEDNPAFAGNKVGQYNPTTGKLREFETPTPFSAPCDLNNSQDGYIYFGEFTGNRVGRLNLGSL